MWYRVAVSLICPYEQLNSSSTFHGLVQTYTLHLVGDLNGSALAGMYTLPDMSDCKDNLH